MGISSLVLLILGLLSAPLLTESPAEGGANHALPTVQTETLSSIGSPDFSIATDPSNLTIPVGSSGTAIITVTWISILDATVNLTSTSMPSGLALSFSETFLHEPPLGFENTFLTVSTVNGTATGTYTVTVTGTMVNISHSIMITVTVFVEAPGAPDFSLNTDPSSLQVAPFESSTFTTITLTSLNGYSGTIDLAATVFPTGPILEVLSTPPPPWDALTNFPYVALSGGEKGSAILTVSTTSLVSVSNYSIAVTGTAGTVAHTVALSLTVSGPEDFSINADPVNISVSSGAYAKSTITVSPLNGFNGVVSLAISYPMGISAALSQTSIVGMGTTTLTVTGNATGEFAVQVTGSSASLMHSTTVFVNVMGVGAICVLPLGSETCPINPIPITGTVGSQLRISILIQRSEGLDGFDITLLADHSILSPAGIDLSGTVLVGTPVVIAECVGGVLIRGSECSSIDTADTLELAATSAPGSPLTVEPTTGLLFTAIYNIIAATSGTAIGFQTSCTNTSVSGGICASIANGTPASVPESVQTASFNSPPPDFTVAVTPTTQTIKKSGSVGFTISIRGTNGFSGTVNLAATISQVMNHEPTMSLPSTSGPYSNSTVTLLTLHSTSMGTYTITVTATCGSITHRATITIVITP